MQAPSVVATAAAPPPLSGSVEHSPPFSGGEEMPVSARLDDDLHLIRSEFQEIPDLRVSLEQAQVAITDHRPLIGPVVGAQLLKQ